ncbi:MAG: DUF1566 domain-containing protein [Desulfuromonadales bacterium]|nr:DUF1566 domain-containing protein [Desulfuromonadales bacterium]
MKTRNLRRIAPLLFAILLAVDEAAAQSCKATIPAATPEVQFILHDNGTVTHKTTGLMWMRCSLGQSWNGKTCTGTAGSHSWQNALKAVHLYDFAGYRDWRLPNKNELDSILEESCASPAINTTVFPATPLSYFWSSSPYAGLAHGAWSIDFGYGSAHATVKSGKVHVRLVRGGG